jgi:hypothetical protein
LVEIKKEKKKGSVDNLIDSPPPPYLDMSISGPLYRRTRRLFNRNKPGDWTLVWCELSLETGEFLIFQEQNGRRLALIPVRESDIAHVRTDGRDCMEIKIKKSKKETLSSHESSYDVDWW